MRKLTQAAIAAVLALLTPTPAAHADPETNYLTTLRNQYITNDRGQLITAANDLCDAAAQQNAGGAWIGMSPNIAAALRTQTALGLDNNQLGIVIRAARNIYCPQNGLV